VSALARVEGSPESSPHPTQSGHAWGYRGLWPRGAGEKFAGRTNKLQNFREEREREIRVLKSGSRLCGTAQVHGKIGEILGSRKRRKRIKVNQPLMRRFKKERYATGLWGKGKRLLSGRADRSVKKGLV